MINRELAKQIHKAFNMYFVSMINREELDRIISFSWANNSMPTVQEQNNCPGPFNLYENDDTDT